MVGSEMEMGTRNQKLDLSPKFVCLFVSLGELLLVGTAMWAQLDNVFQMLACE